MGKMSLTSCRTLSTPGKFSNVDRYAYIVSEIISSDIDESQKFILMQKMRISMVRQKIGIPVIISLRLIISLLKQLLHEYILSKF